MLQRKKHVSVDESEPMKKHIQYDRMSWQESAMNLWNNENFFSSYGLYCAKVYAQFFFFFFTATLVLEDSFSQYENLLYFQALLFVCQYIMDHFSYKNRNDGCSVLVWQ